MKIKIIHKENPAASLGVWNDSTAKIYIKGPKNMVKKIIETIAKIVGEGDRS